MPKNNLFRKALSIIQKRGICGLFFATRSRICYRHKSIWFQRYLDDSLKTIPPKFDGWLDFNHPDKVISWIDEMDIPGTNDKREISNMLKKRHYFVGIMNDRDLIGYIKIGWGKVYILDYDIELELPPDAYFIIDIFVRPDIRGLGAGPFLVSAAAVEMKKRGFGVSIMHVRTDKTPMLRTCAAAGYEAIGQVNFTSLMGRKIFRPHPASLIDSHRHE